jgi:CubicO group peptidase (beta-lactamase class C family)
VYRRRSASHWNALRFSAIKAANSVISETRLMLAPTSASPETAGMSSTALARVDRHIKSRYLDTGRYPGAQLLVYRRGKIVHSSVQGYADLERKAPV